jgi:hypothetical protein
VEKLLLNFLERQLRVIFDGDIVILKVSSNKKISYETLLTIITKIFCLDYQDDNLKLYTKKWFKDKSIEFVGGLDKFLEDCVIILDPTKWVVKHKLYGTIDLDKLEIYPIDSPLKHTYEAIKNYVDKWYEEEVIKVSEKMMGLNDNDFY